MLILVIKKNNNIKIVIKQCVMKQNESIIISDSHWIIFYPTIDWEHAHDKKFRR